MERWESFYCGSYPATFSGASHVRYPTSGGIGGSQPPSSTTTSTSATERGAHAWTSLNLAEQEIIWSNSPPSEHPQVRILDIGL